MIIDQHQFPIRVGVTMEWTITLHEDGQYAEVVTKGIADKDGSLAMVKAIATALRATTTRRVLIDHTHISEVSGEIVDIYYRPDELYKIGVDRSIMVAEVVKSEHREFFDFLETVCVNKGYSFSVFDDKEAAVKWLLEAGRKGSYSIEK
jgi:hypothetical protein